MFSIGLSRNPNPHDALAEIAKPFEGKKLAFIMIFFPDQIDLEAFALAARQKFPNTTLFGCTSAGQISPSGYENDALLAIGFPQAHFRFTSLLLSLDEPVSIEEVASKSQHLAARFSRTAGSNLLALTIIDGLCKQEDLIVAALEVGLKDIPVFGGSAADGLAYKQTFVLHHGKLCQKSALILLLETDLSFLGVGFDHFEPTKNVMVITKANPVERSVLEINGAPAAQEYAKIVGVDLEALSPQIFAENPLLVKSGRSYHVRAIQQSHSNGGLSFLSAIDDGLILTLGRSTAIIQTLEAGLSLHDEFGQEPCFVLGFDCFLRRLEIEHKGQDREASEVLARHHVIGFNTYGEQHLGVHVNQTFVGVAFFRPNGGRNFD